MTGSGCGDDASDDGSNEDGGARDAAIANDGGALDSGGSHDASEALDASDPGADPDAGDASGDSGAPASMALATYCSEGADGYFAWLQRCMGAVNYPDAMRDTFVGRLRDRCLHAERAVADGRLRYDGELARSCLEAAAATDCIGDYFEVDDCERVFEGLVPLGEDCYREESQVFLVGIESCAEGYCENAGACPGQCRAYAERDESCATARCAPEDYCDGAEQVCRARAGRDESCGEAECAIGLTCFGSEPKCVAYARDEGEACDDTRPCAGLGVCIDGECRFRVEAGDPCKAMVQCPEGTLCESGLEGEGQVCVVRGGEDAPCLLNSHCAPPLVCVVESGPVGACADDPAVLGQPCDEGRCAEGLWCSYDTDPDVGVCQMRVGADEDCTDLGLPDRRACVDGLYCTEAGTCAPTGEEGDPCNVFEVGSCVDGLWCSRETGLCTAPAAEDEPCNPLWPDTCEEGLGCACGQLDRDLCGSTSRDPVATDTCKPRVGDGEACYRPSECESLECQFDFEASSAVAGQCVSQAPVCLP